MADSGELRGSETVSFGPFRLIGKERLLIKDGAPVAVGGRALDILIALTDRAGKVVGRRELIDLVWPDVIVEVTNLRIHISALRKILGDGRDGCRYIVNVPGRGYIFVAPLRRLYTASTAPIAAPESVAQRQNLPSPLQLLVGRSDTIAELSSLLLSQRFVSVIGAGGIGKTTVVVAVANTLRQEFGDAVCFVDLSSIAHRALVPSAVASALGCFVQGPDPEPYIRAFVADKRMLIVLDSCEHVIEAAALLSERLFRTATSVHLLTTSREALRVAGEHVYLLTPLDVPLEETPSAAQALASPAVQLFMERAASSGHRTELSDTEAPIVARICRRLDGIALAIELVAGHVGAHGIQGTAELLESDAALFLHGQRSALPRHQTLQAMFDWSFGLLSAAEQKILAKLSVFVGQFTLTAAKSVAADTDDEAQMVTNRLANLIQKSLISISSTDGPAYYQLLDMTRAYAAFRLAQNGEAEKAMRRHATYCAAEAARIGGPDFGSCGAATHARILGNIRKAIAWSFSSSGDLSIGIELAARAAPLFLGLSLVDECRQWCRHAIEALAEADRGTLRELELQEALAIATMYAQGNSAEVREAIARGLELSEALHDRQRQLRLLSVLHIFLNRGGDFSGALAAAKRSAAVAKAGENPIENAVAEWMMGASYHLTGDQAASLRHCKEGLKFVPDFRPGQSLFRHDYHVSGPILARSLWLCGFPDQGCKVARQGINTAESFDHPVSYCVAVLYLVPVLYWSGDVDGAAKYTEIALERAVKYSLAPHRAVGLALRGEFMVSSGDVLGVEALREALKAMDYNQYYIVTLPTSRALAEGLVLAGRPSEALATIDAAVARAEQVSQILWQPDLLRARGEILQAQPRPDFPAAEDSLLRSIKSAHKQSALSWELRAAIPLARMWGEHGRTREAHKMLEDIYRRFKEGFETRDLVAGRRLLDELR